MLCFFVTFLKEWGNFKEFQKKTEFSLTFLNFGQKNLVLLCKRKKFLEYFKEKFRMFQKNAQKNRSFLCFFVWIFWGFFCFFLFFSVNVLVNKQNLFTNVIHFNYSCKHTVSPLLKTKTFLFKLIATNNQKKVVLTYREKENPYQFSFGSPPSSNQTGRRVKSGLFWWLVLDQFCCLHPSILPLLVSHARWWWWS